MSATSVAAHQPQSVVNVDVKASQRVLLRMVLAAVALAALVLANLELIAGVYFRNQLTATGYVVNGTIVVLFLAGMLKMINLLVQYGQEERALGVFMANVHSRSPQLIDGVPRESLIHQRYDALLLLNRQRAPINHSALAAAVVASESTRISVPRYINNILILTGVFGTIVSLSIALLGASNLLQGTESETSMGLVVHGMSTALSTTITAIVCYVVFGYFFLKVSDVQTRLVSTLEETTALHLIPRYETRPENIVGEVADLVHALREVATNMQTAQRNQQKLEEQVNELVEGQAYYLANIASRLNSMRSLLRDGFRLPDEERQ